MRYVVCVVRDRVADNFGIPFCSRHVSAAIRDFTDQINRVAEDNPLYKHPDDFELYRLGFYEDQLARYELEDVPVQLLLGRDAVRADVPNGR